MPTWDDILKGFEGGSERSADDPFAADVESMFAQSRESQRQQRRQTLINEANAIQQQKPSRWREGLNIAKEALGSTATNFLGGVGETVGELATVPLDIAKNDLYDKPKAALRAGRDFATNVADRYNSVRNTPDPAAGIAGIEPRASLGEIVGAEGRRVLTNLNDDMRKASELDVTQKLVTDPTTEAIGFYNKKFGLQEHGNDPLARFAGNLAGGITVEPFVTARVTRGLIGKAPSAPDADRSIDQVATAVQRLRDEGVIVTADQVKRMRKGKPLELDVSQVRELHRNGTPVNEADLDNFSEDGLREWARLKQADGETDALTGASNRSRLTRRLEAGKLKGKVLVFGDMNGLKELNDGPGGHIAGDQALINVIEQARKASQELGGVHDIARLGGDEYAFVVDSEEIAQRFSDMLREKGVSISTGWAVIGDNGRDAMKAADEAMYADKFARKGGLEGEIERTRQKLQDLERRRPTSAPEPEVATSSPTRDPLDEELQHLASDTYFDDPQARSKVIGLPHDGDFNAVANSVEDAMMAGGRTREQKLADIEDYLRTKRLDGLLGSDEELSRVIESYRQAPDDFVDKMWLRMPQNQNATVAPGHSTTLNRADDALLQEMGIAPTGAAGDVPSEFSSLSDEDLDGVLASIANSVGSGDELDAEDLETFHALMREQARRAGSGGLEDVSFDEVNVTPDADEAVEGLPRHGTTTGPTQNPATSPAATEFDVIFNDSSVGPKGASGGPGGKAPLGGDGGGGGGDFGPNFPEGPPNNAPRDVPGEKWGNPVKKIGWFKRATNTSPDLLRENLGEIGRQAWQQLMGRNQQSEKMRATLKKRLAGYKKDTTKAEREAMFFWAQRDSGLFADKVKWAEGILSDDLKGLTDYIHDGIFGNFAKNLKGAGAKIKVRDEWKDFEPIEWGYMPHYQIDDVANQSMGAIPAYRDPSTYNPRMQAREDRIPLEKMQKDFFEVTEQYIDDASETLSTTRFFGHDPRATINDLMIQAKRSGHDGEFLRDTLDHALGGGMNVDNVERSFVGNITNFLAANALMLSGPAQLTQVAQMVNKVGVRNTVKAVVTLGKVIGGNKRLREVMERMAPTVESYATSAKADRHTFLGRMVGRIIAQNPMGSGPWDAASRVFTAAAARPFIDDVVRAARGQKVETFFGIKLPQSVGSAKIGVTVKDAKRMLSEAGVDADAIAKGADLTEDQIDRMAWNIIRDVNGGQRAEDTSLLFQRSPYGQAAGLFMRFMVQGTKQFGREVGKPLKEGRVGPALRWAATGQVTGGVIKGISDAIYDRQPETPDPKKEKKFAKKGVVDKAPEWMKTAAERQIYSALGVWSLVADGAKFGFDRMTAGTTAEMVSKIMDTLTQKDMREMGVEHVGAMKEAASKGSIEPIKRVGAKRVGELKSGKGPFWDIARINAGARAVSNHLESDGPEKKFRSK